METEARPSSRHPGAMEALDGTSTTARLPLARLPRPGEAPRMPLLLLLTACIHDLPWRDTAADTGPEPDAPPTLPQIAAGGGDDGFGGSFFFGGA